jgi:hypothetical protein
MKDASLTLRETVAAWLREQGHETTIETYDDQYARICFRSRGRHFCVRTDENDPVFLCLVTSYSLPEDAHDELLVRRAIATAESATKCFKAEVDLEQRAVVCGIESFGETAGNAPTFWRAFDVLQHGAAKLFETLDELVAAAAAARFTSELEHSTDAGQNVDAEESA